MPQPPLMPPATSQAPLVQLEGVLERITFISPENGYTVARLTVPGHRDVVTIVGHLATPTPGETLRVRGRWKHHPKHGEQLEVASYESVMPASTLGMKKFLGSGCIKGIGTVFAAKLVDTFGAETFQVIDETPERLTEVHGIGKLRKERIITAWAEQREIRNVVTCLIDYKVSPVFAVRIFKAYGAAAVSIVRDNPYKLATDIRGIGFRTADRLGLANGLSKDSPFRAVAGLLHVLQELTDKGHVYVPESVLLTQAQELEIPAAILPAALAELMATDKVVCEEMPGERGVYLKPLHVAETGLARRITEFLRTASHLPPIDSAKALTWVEGKAGLVLTEEQRQAVQLALEQKFMVITGGPGTGKTTILNSLIKILEAKHLRIHLASPTGRAAKRLAEVTGREAMTIHRLLGVSPKGGFVHNRQHPLETDIVVLDECSMLELPLALHLMHAIPLSASVVLVGDADQLPSVGPGTVLRDLLDFTGVPSLRLTRIFRQAEQSRIITNAHRVNQGQMPHLTPPGPGEKADCFFLAEDDPEKLQELIVDLATRRLPAAYRYDPFTDIQVLTPGHRGPTGVAQLNIALQAALNPHAEGKAELARGKYIFRVGDRVMVIKNRHEAPPAYNGDLGRILTIDHVEQQVHIRIDDREICYEFSNLDELTLAFASTVHKCQGAEFACVVAPLTMSHYMLLQRNLLYTAITRARKHLILVGSPKAIACAVRNNSILRRYSYLTERLLYLKNNPPSEPALLPAEPDPTLFELLNQGLSDDFDPEPEAGPA